jgi:hypothetical protein
MSAHRSKQARPPAASVSRAVNLHALGVVVLALAAALLASCSRVSDPSSIDAPESAEPPRSQPAAPPTSQRMLRVGEDVAEEREQALGTLGVPAGDEAFAARKAEAPRQAARLRELHARALLELDYQTAQSRNQRTNEALDYLGALAPEARPEHQDLDAAERRAKLDDRGSADAEPEEAGARFEAVTRLRDDAAAAAAVGKKSGPTGGAGRMYRPSFATPSPEAPGPSPAQRFERERRSLENLRFRPASGYWANTYVPGDPVMRWLESRLQQRDPEALQRYASRPLRLEDAAHQTPQPFDPPHSAAVSVFLQADRRGLDGESRMLVQVGLQGAERHSGLRPAMKVGIVLDLRGNVSTATATAMRALLDGFLEAKDVGDRFHLVVAGAPGGVLVPPDAFRHGPLSLAMARLVEPGGPGGPGEAVLGLEEALQHTAAELRSREDPAAPLGSSLVLLVTDQSLGPLASTLAATAHESAVAGVPVSVVGIGEGVQLAEIERVALAGQGNRRLLHSPAEAERLAERELSALSRVIARALRLRIRLAPGVKLVDVVGSEPLDAAGAQRVRAAERSIDRRLARNLGIEADRGEDEEGIQIVIPNFHSGDSHAVLLDVVAAGPGPIADVTVRYKDLVYLRNGVARANLTLGRSTEPPGPLQRNVVKNLLAIRLSEALKQSGRELMAGADAQALASVLRFQTLLSDLQREVPGFRNDPDLARDDAMLREYAALLGTDALHQEQPRQYLADSLQLSGYFKTVPRSASELRVSRR